MEYFVISLWSCANKQKQFNWHLKSWLHIQHIFKQPVEFRIIRWKKKQTQKWEKKPFKWTLWNNHINKLLFVDKNRTQSNDGDNEWNENWYKYSCKRYGTWAWKHIPIFVYKKRLNRRKKNIQLQMHLPFYMKATLFNWSWKKCNWRALNVRTCIW